MTIPLSGHICAALDPQDPKQTSKTKDGNAVMENTPQMTSGEVEGQQPGDAPTARRQMAQESQRRITQPGDSQDSPRMGDQIITDWASI
ncbi:hypothetical protein [Defluviimonas sp. WL0075]|uniref:Uncharacterized protein n=1 Tax=Albidovulum sediminicola TaxID=2984331 RepID=A0ABT2YZJ0_9RHOB|nr:hypothetical protein [Defluviimonas sp. WL0075]MCV2864296.1 hypothetical protein [Defluviimonas sp. WL0075]